MGRIGNGYGSECHLLRWMGRHRHAFDEAALMEIGKGGTIEWLDFEFKQGDAWQDAEPKGLEFLAGDEWAALQPEWARFWPLGSGIHNWDAVGWLHAGGTRELLLVEAKAHVGEITSECGATSTASQRRIRDAFAVVQAALGVTSGNDWTQRYYQFTNRLATLHFLNEHGVPSRLLFVYFVGDRSGPGRDCPQTKGGWTQALDAQAGWVGLPAGNPLEGRIHKLFLRVDGGSVE